MPSRMRLVRCSRWRVADRIVAPRRQLVFAAVFGPGMAAALGRDLKPKAVIGNHVQPGRRRGGSIFQNRHILAAIRGKAAGAVEKLQRFDGGRGGRRAQEGKRWLGQGGRHRLQPVKLQADIAPPRRATRTTAATDSNIARASGVMRSVRKGINRALARPCRIIGAGP